MSKGIGVVRWELISPFGEVFHHVFNAVFICYVLQKLISALINLLYSPLLVRTVPNLRRALIVISLLAGSTADVST
jgi:hypothetical protein